MTKFALRSLLLRLLVCLFAAVLNNNDSFFVSAEDLDNYVDSSFTCPVTITCSQICVQADANCPTVCDPDLDEELCIDGTCQKSCPTDLVNPCDPNCSPKACPKVNQYSTACQDEYGVYYEQEQVCLEQLLASQTENTFINWPLLLLGLLTTGVMVAMYLWNRFLRTVKRSTQYIEQDGYVTGYTSTTKGTALYVAVLSTLVAFQVTILGYAVASYGAVSQTETLISFEICWSLGFVFSLALKYPYSMFSIFLLPCPLVNATQVCVFLPITPVTASQHEPKYIQRLRRVSARIASIYQALMSCLFVLPNQGRRGRLEYLAVQTDVKGTRYFVHEFRRYNYNVETELFEPGDVQIIATLGDVLQAAKGLTSLEVERRLRVVGPNSIEMKPPSYARCLGEEFSKTFYIYQLFMLWTWVPLYYFYLATIHGSVIVTGGFAVAWFKFRNDSNLFKMTHIEGEVDCLRNGSVVSVPQSDLVPGDVVQVAPGQTYSDMILVTSEGLLVDESALTGESTPMAKTAVDPNDKETTYNPLLHKKHTISAGTTVLESEVTNNLAVVLKTGSYTSKGELLREVFSYERHQFKFDVEVGYVIFLLFLEGLVGFVLVTQFLGDQPVYSWFYGMYIIAAIIPPLLPTVFTVSVGISDNRLAKKRIACNNSQDILIAGKVTKAMFDKTGTLTRQGLDFVSAHCLETWSTKSASISDDLVTGMSCCHGLHKAVNGQLVGNPVDRTMFDASEAVWKEARGSVAMRLEDRNGISIDVLKVFDFDHHRMTQSVIAKKMDGSLVAFVKGSGEAIEKLCREDTLPSDYRTEVDDAHKSGSYVISIALKKLPQNTDLYAITRDQLECDLEFVGIINFKNILRPETPAVIRQLEAGEVQCIMVTGDNLLTGIRIAKEAGMVGQGMKVLHCSSLDEQGKLEWKNEEDVVVTLPPVAELQSRAAGYELAISGDVWEAMKTENQQHAYELAQCIRVYGRCNPFQKVSVVNTFVEMGFVTMMCGDGGNDCGALKAAHVGVALSDAEASIVSPFTSLDKQIDSVLDVLREGRCALASALACYKYILMYGQLEGIDNVIMAFFRVNLTEYAWAFMDGFWVISMSFTLPLAQAATKLAASRPTASLLGAHTVASFCGILFSNVFFALTALAILYRQDWMQCRKWQNDDVSNLMVIGDNYESEVIFLVTGYQFLSTAMAYNFGYEFRQSWLKNRLFVLCICVFTALHFYVTLVPGRLSCLFRVNCENEDLVYSVSLQGRIPIQNPYSSTVMPMDFRITLIVIMVANTLTNIGWDYLVVNGIRKYLGKKRRREVQLVSAKSEGVITEPV